MNLKLHKPLCIFDIESTGLNTAKDRIVEICILKVNPDGSRESKTWLVNPQMPIPKEASDVHGITDEKVKNSPTFDEIAPKIIEMISGCDLAGYNSDRFDVPMLAEELLRVNHDFDPSKIKLIDVQTIFHKMEPRHLSAAYKFYCGKNLENAHSAEADVHATFEILDAQVAHYEDLPNEIHDLSEMTFRNKFADLAGMIHLDEAGDAVFGFGKYKGKKVQEIFAQDHGYYGWLQNADFPLYTKKIFTKIRLGGKV